MNERVSLENNEQKLNWFQSHSPRTKILLEVGFTLHIVYSVYSFIGYSFIIAQYGLETWIERLIGTFLGSFLAALTISSVISAVPYYLYEAVRNKTEKSRRYLDYLAIIFIIVSIFLIKTGMQTKQEADNYRALYGNKAEMIQKN